MCNLFCNSHFSSVYRIDLQLTVKTPKGIQQSDKTRLKFNASFMQSEQFSALSRALYSFLLTHFILQNDTKHVVKVQ